MKYLQLSMLLFCVLIGQELMACSTGMHHSVLSHYNQAQKVFQGKVLSIAKVKRKHYKKLGKQKRLYDYMVKLRVERCFKNAIEKEDVWIGVEAAMDLKIGVAYLIYANSNPYDKVLVCNIPVAVKDSIGLKKHTFLFELPLLHSGYVVEYSKFGKKWAEGQLENGQPVGLWKYYAWTGELQIKGSYQSGLAEGEWQYFFHTSDESFDILDAIMKGRYFKETGTYQVVNLDSSQQLSYRYQLQYKVGQDTITEQFYHQKPVVEKIVPYQNGWRNGKEQLFNTAGKCIQEYHFIQGILNGPFWVKQVVRQADDIELKVEGIYRQDEKYEERHLYYEKDVWYKTVDIILGGEVMD